MKNKTKLFKFLLILGLTAMYISVLVNTAKFLYSINIPKLAQNLQQIEKQEAIINLINNNFYKDVESEDYDDGIYKVLVKSLEDPYSEYYTPEEYENFTLSTTGKYAGIGAVLAKDSKTGNAVITRIYEGSPAENTGLKLKDTIVSADNILSADVELSEFVQNIRGKAGTKVKITYERNGKEKTVDITRQEIITPSVEYKMLDENTGYIQIIEFQENTEAELLDAINALKQKNMENIVYDLRYNPGGLVYSVTDILDDMLPEGIVVYLMDKNGKRIDYTSDAEHSLSYPCVVLVNEYSASASEIFAGAIKDYNYGKIIGTKTYGKGVVQNIFPLPDDSAVKLTIAEYYTPKGHNIHGVGIEPDINLEFEYLGNKDEEYNWEKDNQILEALKHLD